MTKIPSWLLLLFLCLYSFPILPPLSRSLRFNITHLLSPYPDLSDFSDLLRATTVTTDLSDRTSLTLLAVPNSFLRSSDLLRRSPSSASIADVIRYHVLLQYLSLHDLRHFPPSGKLITTLFQTTGRATNNFGSVNVTYDVQSNTTTVRSPAAYSQPPNNATVKVFSFVRNSLPEIFQPPFRSGRREGQLDPTSYSGQPFFKYGQSSSRTKSIWGFRVFVPLKVNSNFT